MSEPAILYTPVTHFLHNVDGERGVVDMNLDLEHRRCDYWDKALTNTNIELKPGNTAPQRTQASLASYDKKIPGDVCSLIICGSGGADGRPEEAGQNDIYQCYGA